MENQTADFYYLVVDATLKTGFIPKEIERSAGCAAPARRH
jgi:hypothetical protein